MPRKKDRVVVTFRFEGRRYSVSGKTKKEAIENKALKLKSLEDGTLTIESTMLLKTWIEICYSQYKTGVKDITLKREQAKCKKWITEPLGNMPLSKIKPLHLQSVLNDLQGYSVTYVKEIHRIIKWIFNLAVQNDLIIKNPASALTRPQAKPIDTRRALTPYEREHFLKVCEEDYLMRYFLVMLYCGCRPSEAMELQFRDIDRKNKTIHIRGTKTHNADRFVPAPSELLELLPIGEPFDYVFKSASGEKINENTHRVLWKRMKRQLNISMGCRVFRNQLIPPYPLDETLKPYCLRHTYCTDLCKSGVDIREAQYLMGHSSIELTSSIYTHTDISQVADAGSKLEKLYQNEYQKTQNSNKNVVPLVVPNSQDLAITG